MFLPNDECYIHTVMDRINTFHKNRLQEYCQSQNISLPKYRTEKETGPSNIRSFQVFCLSMCEIELIDIIDCQNEILGKSSSQSSMVSRS